MEISSDSSFVQLVNQVFLHRVVSSLKINERGGYIFSFMCGGEDTHNVIHKALDEVAYWWASRRPLRSMKLTSLTAETLAK